jgi:Holliday junction DNA helicase RuvA
LIAGVTGILESKGPGWVQVRVGGSVSLQISAPASTVEELGGIGEEVHLHTRLYIKDDEAVLYGFSTPEALRLFQTLNGVSGIGPRTSLALLSALGPQSLINAVATSNLSALSRVPGVGKKSAGRLVLELKGKLEKEMSDAPVQGAGDDEDLVSALMGLGYSAAESRRVVSSLDSSGELSLEEKVRRALQQMAG